VSDVDWRPHHEHNGPTGITVSPNLYIACGISRYSAPNGVNSSKVIVVINKDPEVLSSKPLITASWATYSRAAQADPGREGIKLDLRVWECEDC
jgi:hypothetical protein